MVGHNTLCNQEITIINRLFLDQNDINSKLLLRQLQIKLNGYLNQDKKKGLTDILLITMDQLIEKLVASKLKCCYCNQTVQILYKTPVICTDESIYGKQDESICSKQDKILIFNKKSTKNLNQWTLDRINNNLEHSNENTVIACLKCNLERRCINKTAFQFTKQLQIIKYL